MKKILMTLMTIATLLSADVTKNGNVVIDNESNLQWQDDAVGSEMTWADAIEHCAALNLGGYNDWRLPNIIELKSIIVRENRPAIYDAFEFVDSAGFYWSSTTNAGDDTRAWYASFQFGYSWPRNSKSASHYVRCVR